VLLDLDADEAATPGGRGVEKDGVEGGPVSQISAVSPARGLLEADLGYLPYPPRPPHLRRPGGQLQVGGQLPEEVETHRLGGQQVTPEALLLDELVRLRLCQPLSDLLQDGRRQEVPARSGLIRVQAAAQDTRLAPPRLAAGVVDAGRQALFLPPQRCQQAGLAAEL
jgi:hypothetical protein